MSKQVNKALSPEEQTALSNIQSILNELLQINSGDPSVEQSKMQDDPETQDQEKGETPEEETEEDDKEVEELMKALETTSSDSSTASDDAEGRLEGPQSDESKDNTNEVAKSLVQLLQKSQSSAPKKKKQKSELEQVLGNVVQVLKSQQETVNDLSQAFENVMKGMGVADQLSVVQKQEQQGHKPVAKGQNEELLSALSELIQKSSGKEQENEQSKYEGQGNKVYKNLANREVLQGLVGR